MDPCVSYSFILMLIGVVVALTASRFIKHRIPPNRVIGIRVPKTCDDPAIWYKLHELLGYDLLVISVAMILVGIAILIWHRHWSLDTVQVLFLVTFFPPVLMAVIRSLWRLRKL
ncbi:MAG: SdpI family protein [Bacillota bacterium]